MTERSASSVNKRIVRDLTKMAKMLMAASARNPALAMARESADIERMGKDLLLYSERFYDLSVNENDRSDMDRKQALVWLREMLDLGRLIAARGKGMEKLANEAIHDIDDDFDWD